MIPKIFHGAISGVPPSGQCCRILVPWYRRYPNILVGPEHFQKFGWVWKCSGKIKKWVKVLKKLWRHKSFIHVLLDPNISNFLEILGKIENSEKSLKYFVGDWKYAWKNFYICRTRTFRCSENHNNVRKNWALDNNAQHLNSDKVGPELF